MTARQQAAKELRFRAAEIALARPVPQQISNGDEYRYRDAAGRPVFIGNFTKGLPHDPNSGLLIDPDHYAQWVRSIDSGDPAEFAQVPLGPGPQYVGYAGPYNWAANWPAPPTVRGWESQGAGLTFDLEGPDAQSLTMPPPPSLDSEELVSEMAELYAMAATRDVPFVNWAGDPTIGGVRGALPALGWYAGGAVGGWTDSLPSSQARRRVYGNPVALNEIFRGDLPGERIGPYVSQFLLIGNHGVHSNDAPSQLQDGRIAYGSITVDQRVRVAQNGVDFLTGWPKFIDAQNAADVRATEQYVGNQYRFICCGRDLATYVHYDALYEAYLNACLILLGLGAPRDRGLPFLGQDYIDHQIGFAQFGGPHILTLVTEVATRALKAVRYQKFNVHRRLRPEAVGGLLCVWGAGNGPNQRFPALETLDQRLVAAGLPGGVLPGNRLLPMAFPEGSPMHPSYGAGHATVAGACVTILKAWFDHGWVLADGGAPFAFEADPQGVNLVPLPAPLPTLTVEGELNKLAANIAIGRDWAGVHYYSDWIESYKLGEQVAIRLLEEQKVTYRENFSMTVPLHDGTTIRI